MYDEVGMGGKKEKEENMIEERTHVHTRYTVVALKYTIYLRCDMLTNSYQSYAN
jgi:hypothetical protein